jgi:hypothetical protein
VTAEAETLEGSNASFWGRPDIEGACKMLDIWASCKWHLINKCHGYPTLEWLDGQDDNLVRLVKTGRRRFDVQSFSGTDDDWDRLCQQGLTVRTEVSQGSATRGGRLTFVRTAALVVDHLLADFGSPRLLEGLLLHRYPRGGPYERTKTSYRTYRPKALMGCIVGGLQGKRVQSRLDALLAQMEREFLDSMAQVGAVRRR